MHNIHKNIIRVLLFKNEKYLYYYAYEYTNLFLKIPPRFTFHSSVV